MTEEQSGGRLEALDGLRGIAALGVVVWHYQHFGGDAAAYPYRHAVFAGWLYTRGWLLVDLFFLLSGCVFTYRYLRPIRDGKVLARDFFILRASRLYPLHLMTLLVVTGIQWFRMGHHKPTLLYEHNDLYHFVLNLAFLQVSGLEQGRQYNNPSWSVAVEAYVYLVFFALARRPVARYAAASVGLAMVAMSVYRLPLNYAFVNEFTARGVLGFFLGSLLFLGLRHAEKAGLGVRIGVASLVFLLGAAAMAEWIGYDAFVVGTGDRVVLPHVLVVFPLILTVALTLAPFRKVLAVRPLRFLGDISYTVYLLHVPLQMVMLVVLEWRGIKPPTSDARFFWLFLGTLLILATVTHRYMEVPARERIRRTFLAARS